MYVILSSAICSVYAITAVDLVWCDLLTCDQVHFVVSVWEYVYVIKCDLRTVCGHAVLSGLYMRSSAIFAVGAISVCDQRSCSGPCTWCTSVRATLSRAISPVYALMQCDVVIYLVSSWSLSIEGNNWKTSTINKNSSQQQQQHNIQQQRMQNWRIVV